jgi:hypothetical protein
MKEQVSVDSDEFKIQNLCHQECRQDLNDYGFSIVRTDEYERLKRLEGNVKYEIDSYKRIPKTLTMSVESVIELLKSLDK